MNLNRLLAKAKDLGLPLMVPRSKAQATEELKKKHFKKIMGWKAKLLSQAGRTIMIKVMATTIPTYPPSFWWGFHPKNKKKWDKYTLHLNLLNLSHCDHQLLIPNILHHLLKFLGINYALHPRGLEF